MKAHWAWAAKAVLLVVAGGVLAACTSDDVKPEPCPRLLVPFDSAKLTRFPAGAAGRTVVDVLHEEEFSSWNYGCKYDVDDDTGIGEIAAEVAVDIASSRGETNAAGVADFEYFIAITDSNKTLL
ncbi:MAG: hypothetical protein HQL36_05070, partial [Alphaproteobacteria bacterium]|nr:hypothetical protein [Alphaproteobacteria bacterium]